MPDDDLDSLKHEMETLQREMTDAKRELLDKLEKFIELKVAEGMSRDQAFDLVGKMFRKARDAIARDRRRTFKVVSP